MIYLKISSQKLILTTHYLFEAQEMSDRIAILNKGNLVALDTTENLLKKIETKKIIFKVNKTVNLFQKKSNGFFYPSSRSEHIYCCFRENGPLKFNPHNHFGNGKPLSVKNFLLNILLRYLSDVSHNTVTIVLLGPKFSASFIAPAILIPELVPKFNPSFSNISNNTDKASVSLML